MHENKPIESTNQPLVDKAQATKSNAFMNALIIGVMIGIIIWSVAKNTVGLFTLFPLFILYKLLNKPKKDTSLKD